MYLINWCYYRCKQTGTYNHSFAFHTFHGNIEHCDRRKHHQARKPNQAGVSVDRILCAKKLNELFVAQFNFNTELLPFNEIIFAPIKLMKWKILPSITEFNYEGAPLQTVTV